MEKKEKKSDLEGLLNSLIEKGWKPRNIECKSVKSTDHCLEFYTELKTIGWIMKDERELVSKESNLWQFVCENKLVKRAPTMWERYNADTGKKYGFYDDHSTYRLIESALCDEDKLEEFLLSNIKVEREV